MRAIRRLRALLVAAALAGCSAPPAGGSDGAPSDPDAGTPADARPADASPAGDGPPADGGTCAGAEDGASCDDGDLCTQVDECQAGVCVGTTPIVCEPRDDCHVAGSCVPETGTCTNPKKPDDTPCDDGSICSLTDRCADGACVGTELVEFPGTPCEDGICFADVTVAAGIDFTSDPTATTLMGGGAAFIDVDGDELLDLVVGTEGGTPRLYLNDGDGTFTDTTASSGLPVFAPAERFMGFAAADYDDDGDTDLYLLRHGPNRLLANDGDGTFTDVTGIAGVADPGWSAAAAFGDFDGDGDLDLYVGNYIAELAFPMHTPDPNTLFRNDGDGTFTDVTAGAGVAGAGTTLAVSWSDWNDDGAVDLHVCNDFGAYVEPNRLYETAAGSFTERSLSLGAALEIFCMSIAPGDYDRDGDLDYYYGNIGRNVLLENDGDALWDVTTTAGVELTYDPCFTELFAVSWSAGFHDFDADGWLDLYVSNGYIPAAPSIANPQQQIDALFRHDGAALTFSDISRTAGVDDERIGRGAAFGDYDGDGDIDVVQVNVDSVALLRNDSPDPGGAIQVDTRGRLGNRDGIGARLRLDVGGDTLLRDINPGYGYLSSSQKAAHFGVGGAAEAEHLVIRWPSGVEQELVHIAAGARLVAVEPFATIATATPPGAPVAEGELATVSVTVRNERAVATPISHALELRLPGAAPIAGPTGSTTVPAGATATLDVSMTIPPGAAGGATVEAELVVTAGDAGGGVDQSAVPVSIIP